MFVIFFLFVNVKLQGGGHMRVSNLSGQGLSFGSDSHCSFPEGPGDWCLFFKYLAP